MDTSSNAVDNVLDYPETRKPVVGVPKAPDQTSQILVLLAVWKDILNARLLAVIALLGALAIFGFTIAEPESARLWACAGYSVGILWPVIWLYLKRGD